MLVESGKTSSFKEVRLILLVDPMPAKSLMEFGLGFGWHVQSHRSGRALPGMSPILTNFDDPERRGMHPKVQLCR